MTRKLATLLILVAFGTGIVAGLYVKQNALQTAVMVVQAESAAYKLAAIEVAKECAPKRGWFKR